MSIALWYCPPQGSVAYEVLSQLIMSFQTLFPNSPIFEPHITLTTNLNCNDSETTNKILTSCVAAIQSIKKELIKNGNTEPLVSFEGCTVGKPFFKKVTLDCKYNKYLISISKIMKEMYVDEGIASTLGPFMPHVSLLYSDVNPISKAYLRIIQQRIQDVLDVRLDEVSCYGEDDYQLKWKFDKQPDVTWNIPGCFKVVKCEGPIDQWEVLGRADV